ncbi:MAG: iron-containing redox enzyme family protein [Halopseudomonas sp.]|uniref:iron-containing redox enzyme family protein n=1 Tax=Halopseudomonas sp. TaxID=2901191 RepID=UPI00300394E0
MQSQPRFDAYQGPAHLQQQGAVKALYQALMQPQPRLSSDTLLQARDFLDEQLQHSSSLECELPEDPQNLMNWVRDGSVRTTDAYAQYLADRRQGEPRRYFHNRAHALYFLRHVAPTKMVDGAWLYGVLQQWQQPALRPLVRTYLEELGDGVPAQNHVVLYQLLLSSNDCDELGDIEDRFYHQGTLQLALGQLAADYLPEVLGYNLGYEQLPLHLLITCYELAELGIDPYYFQLHVTIDNSGTGHAQKAVQAVLANLPVVGDTQEFYRRVSRGYQLNDLGVSSTQVINEFNLDEQVVQMLERKANVAGMVHSDYCRIEGRTVNQWLSEPGQIPAFLAALQTRGWIRRDQAPENSRFWHLVQGTGAPMFGVFSGYEQQLLHDWIAGSQAPEPKRYRRHPQLATDPSLQEADTAESAALAKELNALPEPQKQARLIELMAPATHFTPAGLHATRQFQAYLR